MTQICLALDGMTAPVAYRLARQLTNNRVWGYKVNDMLFDDSRSVEEIIRDLRSYGNVFVDVKLHDTPATVANTVRRLARAGATLITVHASGGRKMVEAAIKTYEEYWPKDGLGIAMVTVLTTLTEEQCKCSYGRDILDTMRLMLDETSQGAYGLVCSAEELRKLARFHPELKRIVPGTRLEGADLHEHRRTSTPGQATRDGADLLVVGREVIHAENPGEMLERIKAAMNGVQ